MTFTGSPSTKSSHVTTHIIHPADTPTDNLLYLVPLGQTSSSSSSSAVFTDAVVPLVTDAVTDNTVTVTAVNNARVPFQ